MRDVQVKITGEKGPLRHCGLAADRKVPDVLGLRQAGPCAVIKTSLTVDYHLHAPSRPVIVTEPDSTWPEQFAAAARHLRAALGDDVLRIDHIGSTSVPGLKAKDIIDIQLTVTDLHDDAPWCRRLREAGYTVKADLLSDHLPPWGPFDPEQWRKRYVREPAGCRRTHVHVRIDGRANQRFALLFRDFLRAEPRFADGYARVKERLAELFPASIETYLYVKDPVVDVIVATAEHWAVTRDWRPGASDA